MMTELLAIFPQWRSLLVGFGVGWLCCGWAAWFFFQKRARSIFEAIAHGDEEHRAWLKAKLEEHFG